MSATDVVRCMLTALFAAGAVHALWCGLLSRSSGWRSRGDHLLHTVMALAMAVMPWNGGGMLPEAQTTFSIDGPGHGHHAAHAPLTAE
ncbi:hypothetical protein [Streptomyces mirabilis]|uniref:hypothetical protein n=1 Tax=Streptomyces mirabilis TaxID=68239 RepID=UPI0036E74C4E